MHRFTRMPLIVAALAVAIALAGLAPVARADSSSSLPGLPATAGPELLRMPPAVAPQLTNAGIWEADPILISGATAYRRGEFLYQDWIYDDFGAGGGGQPWTGSPTNGAYRYPTDPVYAHNAADLVELRLKRLSEATAFRVTLNTMVDPERVAFTIALGESDTAGPYPFGANVSGPADVFVTMHGRTAVITDAVSGESLTPAPTASVDLARRQLTVIVDDAAWSPGAAVRVAVGVGLWDQSSDRYLLPAQAQSASSPGGAQSETPAAFFNVGFRDEPVFQITVDEPPVGVSGLTNNWWWDSRQGRGLAANDMSAFTTLVDFDKIASQAIDDSDVPTSGRFSRILASHSQIGDGGVDPTNGVLQQRGNLQPYTVNVPPRTGDEPFGLTLLLHARDGNYNQFTASRQMDQLARRGSGSIVLSPQGRGPQSGFESHGLADVFEAWADVAAHYPLDPDWTVATGYSMGGMAAFRIASAWPDLFDKINPIVGRGEPAKVASLRNVDVLMWNGAADELVPYPSYAPTAQALQDLGYRYELDILAADHFAMLYLDEYQQAADWLGISRIDADPAHITYVVDASDNDPALHLDADHAYWLSNLTTRDAGLGTVDAVSRSAGHVDPRPSGMQVGAGAIVGSDHVAVVPYVRQYQTWTDLPGGLHQDRIELTATNIASVTIDMARAGVSCNAEIVLRSDGPVEVVRAGC